jgi:hypothetical protein
VMSARWRSQASRPSRQVRERRGKPEHELVLCPMNRGGVGACSLNIELHYVDECIAAGNASLLAVRNVA